MFRQISISTKGIMTRIIDTSCSYLRVKLHNSIPIKHIKTSKPAFNSAMDELCRKSYGVKYNSQKQLPGKHSNMRDTFQKINDRQITRIPIYYGENKYKKFPVPLLLLLRYLCIFHLLYIFI